MASRKDADGDEQAGLRRVFLEPSWQEQSPQDHTQLLLAQEGEQPPHAQGRPYDASERLWEPEDEPGLWRLRTAQRLDAYRSYSPPKNLAAMHWSRRPAPPGPAASLTRYFYAAICMPACLRPSFGAHLKTRTAGSAGLCARATFSPGRMPAPRAAAATPRTAIGAPRFAVISWQRSCYRSCSAVSSRTGSCEIELAGEWM